MSARHVMILASAGSGKTYALTHRFVGLLATGARPERIVALTFTRKAAGEFFDEILNKLARAADEGPFPAELARDLERPELEAGDFRRMLREVIEAMPRLRLGTLDGFFARIARTFPFELGLAGEFEVLQEHAARVERARVLQRMFARSTEGLDDAQKAFIEAFKRATFGTEEKRLAARLDRFLDEHQETFLSAPAADCWGNARRIWPDGCAWLEPVEQLPEKQQGRWDAFFAALPEWTPGAPLPRAIEYLLANTLAVWPEVRQRAAEVVVERKRIALTPEECAALEAIVRHLVSAELMRRLETTRGIHAVLRGYEAVYHEQVRRAGRLTFADVQRLLQPEVSGLALAQGGAGGDRLQIDFRLDAQFDHWLLDEFQDTSYGQWSILRDLIDEVMQDEAGGRSFFCVGDVKQAIYTWREGDPRLFRQIFEHYNRAVPGAIEERHLVRSWRSGPAIVAMVNAVFGAGPALAALFPGPASDDWNREWREHEAARPALGGHAAWLYADDEEERFALTVRLLHEIDPLGRGLECAILTQTNAMATALVDYLRREGGIPAVAESDLHVATDNPVGAVILALIQAAAHPGDTAAWEHVAMTPLAGILAKDQVEGPEALTRRVLAQIHGGGFERTADYWLRRLEEVIPAGDSFSRERSRQFVAAAALFDATGSRDAAEFVAFMERHAVRGMEVQGVVRVMTIHKSKGLGFDVVILPDLEGQRVDQRRTGLAVQRAEDRSVEWVLDLPPKLYVEQDPTLSAHVRSAEATAGYEALALLYVAMTRAKRGMYVITKPVGKSESRNYPKVLTATLGAESLAVRVGGMTQPGGWSAGDPVWWHALGETSAPPVGGAGQPADEPPVDTAKTGRALRRPSRRPSEIRNGTVGAESLFAFSAPDRAEFGTSVHACLAEVEWADSSTPAERSPAREVDAAAAEARACLEAPALAAVWARVEGGEVWRERAFEIILDGAWVTGVFDRVVVRRGAGGDVRAATVYDFKTDRVENEADVEAAVRRHGPQLSLYRRVAAALTGLPPSGVGCELVFTALRRRVPVAP
jgi:ATP-dependent helicase/nuclease subunit A